MLSILGAVALVVGLLALRARYEFAIGAVVVASLLESAAALSVPGLGSIQPAHVLLGFLILRTLFDPERGRAIAYRAWTGVPERCLIFTCLWGVAGAVFLPLAFQGAILVNPVRSSSLVEGIGLLPLEPTAGNITQSVYFVGDVVFFLLVSTFIQDRRRYSAVATVYLVYCGANIAFAVADLFTAKTGTAYLLAFMRNSTYAIYDDAMLENLDRVKGSFTEASAFATASIGPFCFTARLFLAGVKPKLCASLALASLAFILLSTSSTGYGALFLSMIILYSGSAYRLVKSRASANDMIFVMFGPLAAMVLLLSIMIDSAAASAVGDFLEAIVFSKSISQSGIERAAMNREGMVVFLQTFYLGAGIGSVRASSLVVAALSNLGLVGSFAYVMFFGTTVLPRQASCDVHARNLQDAARYAVAGTLFAAILSAALVDLGLAFFALAALAQVPLETVENVTRNNAAERIASHPGCVSV